MYYFSIFMFIFAACIFLAGLEIFITKKVHMARYHGRTDKAYVGYLGKTIMLVALCPILTGLVGLLGESGYVVLGCGVVCIGSFIIIILLSQKWFKVD